MTWTAQAIWLAAGDTRVPGYGGQYKHPKCHHIWHGVLSSTDELVHLSNQLPIGQGGKTLHESKIPAICWFRCENRHQLTIWMTSNDLIIDAEAIWDDPQFYKPAKNTEDFWDDPQIYIPTKNRVQSHSDWAYGFSLGKHVVIYTRLLSLSCTWVSRWLGMC